ncbi:hypothetical protein CRE_20147 [Caenorhabditis remanei]|uniref:Uncharacterized protein n=1 Tax=Caenorhabditis remanei TaxID=31234 RepID=E3NTK4_CAERE|nr:hypothetical protein CRE_20147 [Caenorhabditis remanei]
MCITSINKDVGGQKEDSVGDQDEQLALKNFLGGGSVEEVLEKLEEISDEFLNFFDEEAAGKSPNITKDLDSSLHEMMEEICEQIPLRKVVPNQSDLEWRPMVNDENLMPRNSTIGPIRRQKSKRSRKVGTPYHNGESLKIFI